MSPPDHLRSELALRCAADGRLLWCDERAAQRLAARVGLGLRQLCTPGSEARVDALLAAAGAARVDAWELAVVLDGRPATLSCAAAPDGEGGVWLVATPVPEVFTRAVAAVEQAMQESVRLHREVVAQKRELERRHRELAAMTQSLRDSNSGLLTMHAEVAQHADELHRQNEIKARVVANVSHEFRTPLHAILGLTQLLADGADGPLAPEQRKQVLFIRSSAEELLQLVNDVLDLTRVEAGRAPLRLGRFGLEEFVASLRGMLRPLVPEGGAVSLDFVDAPADVELESDRGKLSQVLRNLVANALKFTERGHVRVTAEAVDDGATVRFSVADTGVGIPPELHDKVFEEFVQVEGPRQSRLPGTGLGLPLARQLTAMLSGELGLHSEPGVGSTFTVEVPRVHPEASEMRVISARSAEQPVGPASILVVEDDRKTIFIYEKYLTMAGFHVVPVRDLEAARAVLAVAKPAAIVLDIVLESETSWSFLAEIKRNPHTADIPVLVVTVTNREQKARALGADEFWLKPIDQDRLLRKLRSLARANPAPRVLVVDDDERARYIMRRHLRDTPYQLIEAADGHAGIEAARTRRPHVIFLDFLLDRMTAFDVLDELKADPRTRSIPVIIITSHVLAADDRLRLLAEAEAVISKESLSRELAINRIRDALAKAGVHATSSG
ncbi:MAG: response regulator [Myxococcales bacterium]|nr:response regulator [Myxococcales bacterium]